MTLPAAPSERPLRVVRVVTLEVSSEWAALLNLVQRQANTGAEWLLVNPRRGLVAPVGQMLQCGALALTSGSGSAEG